ncbi:hypothetical protein ABH926_003756 [Catenulispora sp. GP43]|uniref:hypothetical protein n=1 Tax=Catenulispora sp. GP43 TaxID=3156263 RepID=UPI0035126189
MVAQVVTVRIDVSSWWPGRAKAVAQELGGALTRDTKASVEPAYDAKDSSLLVHFVLHTPTKPIAAAVIAVAVRHPKARITVRQGMDFDVVIAGEPSEEQSRHLAAVLGDYGDFDDD